MAKNIAIGTTLVNSYNYCGIIGLHYCYNNDDIMILCTGIYQWLDKELMKQQDNLLTELSR